MNNADLLTYLHSLRPLHLLCFTPIFPHYIINFRDYLQTIVCVYMYHVL